MPAPKEAPSLAVVQDTFDESVADYSAQIEAAMGPLGGSHDFFMQHKAQLVREFVAKHFGKRRVRVLDVGCGMGLMHQYLDDSNIELHGIDISPKSIEYAAAHNPHVQYHVHEGERFPLDTGSFDLSFATCVMHHVPVPMWEGFMREMTRIVGKGKYVMVVEHNPLNPATQWVVHHCEIDRDAVLLAPWTLKKLFRGAKLRAIRTRNILFTPFRARVFRALDDLLSRVPLGAQYVMIAQKSEAGGA